MPSLRRLRSKLASLKTASTVGLALLPAAISERPPDHYLGNLFLRRVSTDFKQARTAFGKTLALAQLLDFRTAFPDESKELAALQADADKLYHPSNLPASLAPFEWRKAHLAYQSAEAKKVELPVRLHVYLQSSSEELGRMLDLALKNNNFAVRNQAYLVLDSLLTGVRVERWATTSPAQAVLRRETIRTNPRFLEELKPYLERHAPTLQKDYSATRKSATILKVGHWLRGAAFGK